MRTNRPAPTAPPPLNHEGIPAHRLRDAVTQLRRSVMSCLLWEAEFYEDGQSIAARLDEAAMAVTIEQLAQIAIEARTDYKLRHVPLKLLLTLIDRGRGNSLVAETIEAVIQRADELSELVALYWAKGKRPLSGQMKRGLARAFAKFDAYQLGKYNRENAVQLRDVLFLCHAKPIGPQVALWKALANKELASPDTWEVALSAGKDKRATFERLIADEQLGYLALLRNLRGMVAAGVDENAIRGAILARRGAQRVFPFRYVAAARAVPHFEPVLDEALVSAIDGMEPLSGTTIVLVDISPSMKDPLSDKADLTRMDAACTLASIIPGRLRVFSFSEGVVEVPPRRGMAGVDALKRSQPSNGTLLGKAVAHVNQFPHDRLIVITDEESQDPVGKPTAKLAYMINVASYKHGVGYGKPWVHLDGFSENVLRWIAAHEANRAD